MSDWKYIKSLSNQSVWDVALKEYGNLENGVQWLLEDNVSLDLSGAIPYGTDIRIRKSQAISKDSQEVRRFYDEQEKEVATAEDSTPSPGGGGGSGSVCLPATIYYSDGATVAATVQPNGQLTIPEHNIYNPDGSVAASKEFDENYNIPYALIKDQNNNTIDQLGPGDIFQLLNWILKNTGGTQLDTGYVTNTGNQVIIAPDGSYVVEDANGNQLASGNVMSGGNIVEIIASTDIDINGITIGQSLAGQSSFNISVVDQDGNQIGSWNGSEWEVTFPQKSGILYNRPGFDGQVTQFRTGDYGYHAQQGRYDYKTSSNPDKIAKLDFTTLSDAFTTMANNNVFGNKNRFTDINGNDTSSLSNSQKHNTIILDHLTGMMWYYDQSAGAMTWNNAVDQCYNATYGGYNDWAIPGEKEMMTIYELSSAVTRAFDTALGLDIVRIWTGLSNMQANTSYKIRMRGTSNNVMEYEQGSNSYDVVMCRPFDSDDLP